MRAGRCKARSFHFISDIPVWLLICWFALLRAPRNHVHAVTSFDNDAIYFLGLHSHFILRPARFKKLDQLSDKYDQLSDKWFDVDRQLADHTMGNVCFSNNKCLLLYVTLSHRPSASPPFSICSRASNHLHHHQYTQSSKCRRRPTSVLSVLNLPWYRDWISLTRIEWCTGYQLLVRCFQCLVHPSTLLVGILCGISWLNNRRATQVFYRLIVLKSRQTQENADFHWEKAQRISRMSSVLSTANSWTCQWK